MTLGVQMVKAEPGTIYIRADGSIDPSDAPISTLDDATYTLTGNITSDGDGIVAERDNIIIEGAGYTVQGSGSGTGIYLSGRSNVTLQNINIKRFNNGIVLQGSNNNSVSRNNITEIYWIGIYSSLLSSNNIVSGNNVANNGYGISLSSSSNNIVSKNTVTNNGLYGITLSDDISVNNTISDNTMTNNSYNIYFVGGFNNTISRNNIASSTYGIFLHSSNNTVSENIITNNEYGITLNYPSNNRFYHNNLIDNTIQVVPHLVSIWDDGYPSGGNYWSDYAGADADGNGLGDTPYIIDSDNQDRYPLMHSWSPLPVHDMNTGLGYATIQEAIDAPETLYRHMIFVETGTYYEHVVINKPISLIGENKDATIIDGQETGTVVEIEDYVENATLSGFTIQNSGKIADENQPYYDSGIRISWSNANSISGNVVINNKLGIYVLDSFYNTISNNRITNNSFGFYFMGWSQESDYNVISENDVTNNEYGMYVLWGSNDNDIYHNSFVDNTEDAYNVNSINAWDNGVEGNYWSDYNGNDVDHDGIGDTPCVIDANNTDHYPLMGMFSDFNATSEYSVQTICNSSITDFQFNGTAISFNVSGDNDTTGFCRICIPTAMMSTTYKVFVNGTEVSHNLLPCSNETYSYVYFNYTHSTQEVIIIPEFPSFLILLLFMTPTLSTLKVCRRKRR